MSTPWEIHHTIYTPHSLRCTRYPQQVRVPTFVRGTSVYTCTRPAICLLCSHISADATLLYTLSHTFVLLTLPISPAAFSPAHCWYGCHSTLSPGLPKRTADKDMTTARTPSCICSQPQFITAFTQLPCHREAVTQNLVQSPTKLDRLPKMCIAMPLLAPMTPCMQLQSYSIVSMDKPILSSYTDQ